MEEKLDDMYHVEILDSKSEKVMVEAQLRTLEEVLGCLHGLDEADKNGESIEACLMGLRDGMCSVRFRQRTSRRVLRIRPTEAFKKLFWEGFHKSEE